MIGRLFKWLLVLALLLTIMAGVLFYWASGKAKDEVLPLTGEQLFEVLPGETLNRVTQRLVQAEVIHHPHLFYWTGRLQGYDRQIKVGEYRLTQGLTVMGLLELLSSGQSVQHAVKMLEGWTLWEIQAVFESEPRLRQTLTDWSPQGLAKALNLPMDNAEGQFYPDTYFFSKGMTDQDVLLQAHRRLREVVADAWEGRSAEALVKSPEELLILASIVEKETGQPHERPLIAGVFNERLRLGMRLQTDPTVIYGLGREFDGNLTRKHLRDTDNPYNTYSIPGLPPGPVALASEAAIHAAARPLNPEGYLFFVAKGDGSHAFSKTLQEHNRAVRDYQLNRRQDYRSH